ncbi:Gp19/Gp15/Gp42 family protein [Corynebacterium callunae]|uniref:Gp19/Gp15/Gp42 family protein n=1 Tax=Corynebacterium callunae TaxID=1721 RepID=UPI001FFE87BF|nr:phage Gp19/Gp15/Gp42 family protein [Corynebacterium callunae]
MLTEFISQIETLFPRVLEPEETARAQALVERAYDLIDLEFMRRGRSLEAELRSRRDVEISVGQAILEMVSRAILVGDSEGQASVSSTTGQESDSVTWSQGIGIRWGGVGIDDSIRRLLGLFAGGLPRGGGVRVVPYGLERSRFLGAEFGG